MTTPLATINLLPWREHLRARHKRAMLAGLLLAAGLAALITLLLVFIYSSLSRAQAVRNQTLQGEMAVADARLGEMARLGQQAEDFRAHSAHIETLQAARPVTAHILNDLAAALPGSLSAVSLSGIYYQRIVRNGSRITIHGRADSHAHITELMRRLEASPWLHAPLLNHISTLDADYDFSLSLSQVNPSASTGGEDESQP